MRRGALVVALSVAAAVAFADVPIPPAPQHYFNDYASLVSPSDAARLDARLEAFEQESRNQVVVAIFPELPSPSLEDFTVRTAQAWRVGQKKLDNGVVLFVFVKDRKSRLEVGYGLEDKIPDAVAKRIVQDAAGLDAAIDAIIAATRGASAPALAPAAGYPLAVLFVPLAIVLAVLAFVLFRLLRWASSHGWRASDGSGSSGSSSSDWSSSSSSTDSSGSSSSSDFSGGGGSFGGGGASGDW